jgi:hypothetical protein
MHACSAARWMPHRRGVPPVRAGCPERESCPGTWRERSCRCRLGAPGRPCGLTRLGSRLASARARRRRNSIWALVLRSSSPAQRASASCTSGSSRRRICFRSVATPGLLLVERAGVDDRLCWTLAAQDDEQVADHGGASKQRAAPLWTAAGPEDPSACLFRGSADAVSWVGSCCCLAWASSGRPR